MYNHVRNAKGRRCFSLECLQREGAVCALLRGKKLEIGMIRQARRKCFMAGAKTRV